MFPKHLWFHAHDPALKVACMGKLNLVLVISRISVYPIRKNHYQYWQKLHKTIVYNCTAPVIYFWIRILNLNDKRSWASNIKIPFERFIEGKWNESSVLGLTQIFWTLNPFNFPNLFVSSIKIELRIFPNFPKMLKHRKVQLKNNIGWILAKTESEISQTLSYSLGSAHNSTSFQCTFDENIGHIFPLISIYCLKNNFKKIIRIIPILIIFFFQKAFFHFLYIILWSFF